MTLFDEINRVKIIHTRRLTICQTRFLLSLSTYANRFLDNSAFCSQVSGPINIIYVILSRVSLDAFGMRNSTVELESCVKISTLLTRSTLEFVQNSKKIGLLVSFCVVIVSMETRYQVDGNR